MDFEQMSRVSTMKVIAYWTLRIEIIVNGDSGPLSCALLDNEPQLPPYPKCALRVYFELLRFSSL